MPTARRATKRGNAGKHCSPTSDPCLVHHHHPSRASLRGDSERYLSMNDSKSILHRMHIRSSNEQTQNWSIRSRIHWLPCVGALTLLVSGCSDPADQVHKSATSEPQREA